MLKRTAIMILKKITSVIIFPILFHTSSCALIPDDYMPQITAENMAAGFFEALKNKDISEANTYLSLSALNGKEKYSGSLYDFMDYMDGDIINIDFEGHYSHESRMEESRHYSRIYTYSIETAGQLLEGQIRVCSVDTDNPGDVGIYYIEIYPKEYYDWFTYTETSFDRLTLPGIYIYDESVRPYPPEGQNSRNKINTIFDFWEALKIRDVDEAASYLSISAVNSDEKDNKTIEELINYTYGKITYYNYNFIDSHFEYADNNWLYYETYKYHLHTWEEVYTGYLDICAYDTKNPDNIGIFYVDLACPGYYGNKPDYRHPELTGIFIYE